MEKEPTRFVIMAGLPGTGKTALGEVLSQRLGGIVLSKDRVRAVLFPPGAIDYSDAQDDFCMSVVLQAAQRIAVAHKVPFIFLDGRTFSCRQQVQQAVEAAATARARMDILHLHCPDALALERIQRGSNTHPAANRDAALYSQVQSHFEPLTLPKLDVDTSQPLAECVAQSLEYLLGR